MTAFFWNMSALPDILLFAVFRHAQFYDSASNFEGLQIMPLLRHRRDIVLIDSGSSEAFIPLLRIIGVTPSELNTGFLKRFHRDHIKGLFGNAGSAEFSNVLFYIRRLDLEFPSPPADDIVRLRTKTLG